MKREQSLTILQKKIEMVKNMSNEEAIKIKKAFEEKYGTEEEQRTLNLKILRTEQAAVTPI